MRIPKELRLVIHDSYAPAPKSHRPQTIRINAGKWGRFERNRIKAQEAFLKSGSPTYGKLPISAWVTVSAQRGSLPRALGFSDWYSLAFPWIKGFVVSFSARSVESEKSSIEVLIRREDI